MDLRRTFVGPDLDSAYEEERRAALSAPEKTDLDSRRPAPGSSRPVDLKPRPYAATKRGAPFDTTVDCDLDFGSADLRTVRNEQFDGQFGIIRNIREEESCTPM